VAALTVGVDDESDVGAAVRVVLDALDLGRDRVLVADEIDDAIVVLVTATLVARRDVAVVVAAGVLHLRLEQRRFGPALVQVRMRDLDDRAPARRRRLDLDDGHYAPSPEKFSSWPCARQTYAFLTWSRRPTPLAKRFVLPLCWTVCTESTVTLNISSTAALISGLVASRMTLNSTWLCFSAAIVAFSLTIGAIRIWARRLSACAERFTASAFLTAGFFAATAFGALAGFAAGAAFSAAAASAFALLLAVTLGAAFTSAFAPLAGFCASGAVLMTASPSVAPSRPW